MSTKTLGTSATTSLTALPFAQAGLAAADVATIANGVLNDLVNGTPVYPGAFSSQGLLYIPNRGVLAVLPGDYVAIDNKGWPVLISAYSIANGAWTHS